MTDQELTVLAAQAAGVNYEAGSEKPHPTSGAWFGLWLVFDREPHESDRRYWNPLADDGDALRGAAHQGIGLIYYREGVRAVVDSLGRALGVPFAEVPDRAAATRRAITRALAAIALDRA